jgi:hypothetical protein
LAAADVAAELAPIIVTDAVIVPAAGADGFVTLNLQLAVPCAGRFALSQLETGTVAGDWPETVTVIAEMVAGAAAVFCTVTVPAT